MNLIYFHLSFCSFWRYGRWDSDGILVGLAGINPLDLEQVDWSIEAWDFFQGG